MHPSRCSARRSNAEAKYKVGEGAIPEVVWEELNDIAGVRVNTASRMVVDVESTFWTRGHRLHLEAPSPPVSKTFATPNRMSRGKSAGIGNLESWKGQLKECCCSFVRPIRRVDNIAPTFHVKLMDVCFPTLE